MRSFQKRSTINDEQYSRNSITRDYSDIKYQICFKMRNISLNIAKGFNKGIFFTK